MRSTRAIAVATLALLLTGAARAQEKTLPEPLRQYIDARKLLYADDLPSAVELFERVVREHGDSEVADDGLYWAGWCRMRLPDGRPRAVEAWLRLLKRHPESPWLDEAAAGLREPAGARAEEVLRAALAKRPAEPVRNRLQDGLAALGLEDVIPALETRLRGGDVEAALSLSRLGLAGAAILEETLRSELHAAEVRHAAFRGFSRAVRTEKTVPAERARAALEAVIDDPFLLDLRRPARALLESLKPAAAERPGRRNRDAVKDDENTTETIRRLRREVAELREQVEELTELVRKRFADED